jgi:hypothetical protein
MGSAPISFDPASNVEVEKESVSAILEMYCLTGTPLPGGVIKEFPLKGTVIVDSVSGTLSFNGLNWPWWKRGQTAICGFVGYDAGNLLAFDIQGHGNKPQIIPVNAVFPGGVSMSKLVFNLYADLTLPTDFRIALVFHRIGEIYAGAHNIF